MRFSHLVRPFSRLLGALLMAAMLGTLTQVVLHASAATVPPSGPSELPLESTDKDSINMRKDLQKRITRFHRTWRDAWLKSMIDRGMVNINIPMTINDYSFRNFTPEVKRYQSLLCNAGWIGEGGMAGAEGVLSGTAFRAPSNPSTSGRPGATERMVAAAMASTETPDGEMATPISGGFNFAEGMEVVRRIRGERNKGQVCPLWIADEETIPLDEGERLDLALPVATRPRIRRSRDTIINKLTEAMARFPGDAWVAGQRVRFLVDNYDLDAAVLAASECTVSESLCASLQGLAYEQRGDLLAADSAFRRGVAAEFSSSAAAACVDTTAFVLIASGPRRDAHKQSCARQQELVERLWWLSDPLWSVPGNERFVLHYSRRTSLALRAAFDEDERYIWRPIAGGEALQEAIMRYGWPTHTYWGGYQMDSALDVARQSQMMQPEAPYTSKEYAPDRVALVPAFRAIENPFDAEASDWPMERPDSVNLNSWWPVEHQAFRTRIATLAEGQTMLLRRDTAVLYGVAIDDPIHQMEPGLPVLPRAYLMASTSPAAVHTVVDTTLPFGRSLRLSGLLAPEPQVLSLEIPGRSATEIAHRRRFGVTPPPSLAQMADNDLALSDPVFVLLPRRGAAAPTDPAVVQQTMVGSLQVPRSVPFALYWESYGFVPGDSVDVEVRIARREETSALRRLGAALGVADAQRDSISIKWSEPDPGRAARVLEARIATVSRAIAVDLRNLVPGNYIFRVEMTRPDGRSASGERRITILE